MLFLPNGMLTVSMVLPLSKPYLTTFDLKSSAMEASIHTFYLPHSHAGNLTEVLGSYKSS
jgi:hypothetical protein